jgi:hypothetical protein
MVELKTEFQPLDRDIVSASIPAFFIGRNKAGFWVARESKGRVGGIFLFKSSAVEFARAESAPSQCALIFPTRPFELDIENRGNPLIARLALVISRLGPKHLYRVRPPFQ